MPTTRPSRPSSITARSVRRGPRPTAPPFRQRARSEARHGDGVEATANLAARTYLGARLTSTGRDHNRTVAQPGLADGPLGCCRCTRTLETPSGPCHFFRRQGGAYEVGVPLDDHQANAAAGDVKRRRDWFNATCRTGEARTYQRTSRERASWPKSDAVSAWLLSVRNLLERWFRGVAWLKCWVALVAGPLVPSGSCSIREGLRRSAWPLAPVSGTP